ncbi:hypothetical protein NUU61_001432 [Penicillium alfredii]|uniref:Uncharacterized protein n=1 Tax=Penicillium alfredii TaxID=1506179 RepID=A0A9W9G5R0_9EURO|nr:uncharacterized protein NUU61_001432 [Penicillium alfredii]KAJ5111802.1 hypothetical protein NUU61_001432 [Penicillium alfredii]
MALGGDTSFETSCTVHVGVTFYETKTFTVTRGKSTPKSTNIRRDVQDNTSHHGATDPVVIDKRGGVCVSTVSSTTTIKPRHVAVVTPTSPDFP